MHLYVHVKVKRVSELVNEEQMSLSQQGTGPSKVTWNVSRFSLPLRDVAPP